MKKIVFVSIGSLEKYLYDALCIDSFFEEGKEVVYLDLSYWLFGEEKIQKYDFVTLISSAKEFEDAIKKHVSKETYFNVQIYYESRFYRLFHILTQHNCQLCRFNIGYLPEVSVQNRAKNYLKSPFDFLRRLYEKTSAFLALKFKLVNLNFVFVFAAGRIARKVGEKQSNSVIDINYIDCEYRKEYILNPRFEYSHYAVFLDTYLADHEDMDYDPALGKINARKYIDALNHFFDMIESELGLEVIIAAHPKSNYDDNIFKQRKCIKNETAGLVFNSSLVISQHSTAISYAVLDKKSITLIYTSEMEERYQLNIMPFMNVLANELCIPLINIDTIDNVWVPNVSNDAYDKYKYDYLTSVQSEHLSNKDIFRKFLRNEI